MAKYAMPAPRLSLLPALESELAARWARGIPGALRLEDGRAMRVIFPGIPGPGVGPDFRDALVEIDGDILRGDVELHLRASGWFAHGHHTDRAFDAVILHVVARNDLPAAAVPVAGRTPIPIAVLTTEQDGEPPPAFTPPCVFAHARGIDTTAALSRLGRMRLRQKAARIAPLLATTSPSQLLYAGLLDIFGGSSNRATFASLARTLPLALLLERAERPTPAERDRAIAAEFRLAAASLVLRRAGMRPLAAPGRRLDLLARAVQRTWPGELTPYPTAFAPSADLIAHLRAAGVSRSLAVEATVNAVLPVALASGAWPESAVLAAWDSLPSPGTYGKLRRLQSWLSTPATPRPLATAAHLQGALLLHADYCARGRCGRCPLSC